MSNYRTKQRKPNLFPEEIAYIRDNFYKQKPKEIAEWLGVTLQTVYKHAHDAGMYKSRKWTREEKEYIMEHWKELGAKKLAEKFGVGTHILHAMHTRIKHHGFY